MQKTNTVGKIGVGAIEIRDGCELYVNGKLYGCMYGQTDGGLRLDLFSEKYGDNISIQPNGQDRFITIMVRGAKSQ